MPYFIVVFLIFVFFISNVCKVNVYSKTIDPSPLKFEQARRLAINRLEYCTSNRECRQKNFNDILSGWWNLGTFSQNYKTSIKIMYSSAIKNGILSRLKDSNLCALQGQPNCLIHYVYNMFNAKRYNVQYSDKLSLNLFGLKDQIILQLNRMAPWNSQSNRIHQILKPDAHTLDFLLVFTWASFRVGLNLGDGWNVKDMLNWLSVLQPYPIPHTSLEYHEYEITRSLTFAILHAIYVTGEFGLASVSVIDTFSAEYEYLKSAFIAANFFHDFEIMGEIIDVFDVAGVKRNYKNVEKLINFQNIKNINIGGKKQGLGTWGTTFQDINNIHQHYVCTLALFERKEERFKKNRFDKLWSNKKYWDLVKHVYFPHLFIDEGSDKTNISRPNGNRRVELDIITTSNKPISHPYANFPYKLLLPALTALLSSVIVVIICIRFYWKKTVQPLLLRKDV